MKRLFLIFELCCIFILPPVIIYFGFLPKQMIMPLLWILGIYALSVLYAHCREPVRLGWHPALFKRLFKRFLLFSLLLGIFVVLFFPERLFDLIRQAPFLYFFLLVFYPLLSVTVQELIFRRFYFSRYLELFGSHIALMSLTNAFLFAFVHIVFGNWIAVVLSFFGGLLFADTYLKSRSLLMPIIEHSLYGNLIFTLGLGYFFYHGNGF